MRLPTRPLPRRALLHALVVPLAFHPRDARAGERTTAQSVGIDVGSPLLDPRDPFGADKGIIWGGRDRCDPTDVTCQQGGVDGSLAVQPVPTTPDGFEATDKVRFAISLAGEAVGEIEIELWGKAAPGSVDAFMKLCLGTLKSSAEDEPASYVRSVLLRVQRDKQVVFGGLKQQGGHNELVKGKTRPQRFVVQPPANDDANALSHAAAGLLSVRKGGGSFEFGLTTRPSQAALDRESLVIGRVAKGMELLERLNTLPTNNYNAGPMATVRIDNAVVMSNPS